MAEMKGPGCIWRIWSAAAEKGHVKIYLDGQLAAGRRHAVRRLFRRPACPVHLPAALLQPDEQGCRGQNLYLPIPYQKSCKVVADKGWGSYYHFTYATYPGGDRRCPPSARPWPPQHAAELKAVDAFFADEAGHRPGRHRGRARRRSHRAGRAGPGPDGPRGPARRSAGDHRAAGEGPASSDREDEMAGLRQAGPADHLGRPAAAGRVVPAGRFLRHGPRREPVQDRCPRA